jgi:hypothetical protein
MAKKIVDKPYNHGTLTESQFFSKIRSALRNAFRYWKPAQEALKLAGRPSENKENKRLKTEYKCANCKDWFKRADVQIDHVIECGSLSCYDDIAPFIQRLAIEDIKGYQVLCKPCHKEKTNNFKQSKKERKPNATVKYERQNSRPRSKKVQRKK